METTLSQGPPSAAEIADTGLWRLVADISACGMSAWLKRTDEPGLPARQVMSVSFGSDESTLLKDIENAVYDHPLILDDFSADFIITTPKTIWIPSEVTDITDADRKCVEQLWPANPEGDFFTDSCGEAACLYLLTPGLKAFLGRTFPGIRIVSHQSVLLENFNRLNDDGMRLNVNIRDGEADFILTEGKRLLGAVTHGWLTSADVAWHALNLLQSVDADPLKTRLLLSGERTPQVVESRNELNQTMRGYFASAMLAPVPHVAGAEDGSLAARFRLTRQSANFGTPAAPQGVEYGEGGSVTTETDTYQ